MTLLLKSNKLTANRRKSQSRLASRVGEYGRENYQEQSEIAGVAQLFV